MTPALDRLAPWIDYTADRAGGPGGQHVNKVNTRITLLFDFAACPLLTDYGRERIRQLYATRLASDGRLRIVSQSARSQSANRESAGERLIELLRVALHRPKRRIATKPSAGAERRRIAEKRRVSERKQSRRGASPTNDRE